MSEVPQGPFPSEIFANSPITAMQDNLERSLGLPPQLVGSCLLSAVSMAAGKGIEVESFEGRTCRPNLYVVAGVQSGLGKSELGKRVFASLYEEALKRRRVFLFDERPKIKAQLCQIEAQLKKVDAGNGDSLSAYEQLSKKRCELEAKLREPKFIVEDSTQEALEAALEVDGTLAVVSTDARPVFKNLMGRYRQGATEEDALIKGWTGDRILVDRISRAPLWVDDPCLSMCLMVQPDLFSKVFLNEGFLESGFLPRILPVSVQSIPRVFDERVPFDEEINRSYAQRLVEIFQSFRFRSEPARITLDEGARNRLQAFRRESVSDEDLYPDLAVCIRRWAELAVRISLCLHVAYHGQRASEHSVIEYFAWKAIELVRWFGEHQRDLLLSGIESKKEGQLNQLRNIVMEKADKKITVRMAAKRIGCSSEEIRKLIADEKFLVIESVPTGGRPSEVVTTNFMAGN